MTNAQFDAMIALAKVYYEGGASSDVAVENAMKCMMAVLKEVKSPADAATSNQAIKKSTI